MRDSRCDVLVVGAGCGGFAAALSAARMGLRVVLTEETSWIGGQLTAQGVPPDEHPWIESFGCTATYREFRNRVREIYRELPLTPEALANPLLNPGGGWVSKLCAQPALAHFALQRMLSEQPNIELRIRRKPMAADIQGDEIRSVTLRNLDTGDAETVEASFGLDATELGDLLALAKVEYFCGAESRDDTGEPNAVEGFPEGGNVQGLTWVFALGFDPAGRDPIEKPSQYEKWKNWRSPAWPGSLLSFEVFHAHTGELRTLPLFETLRTPSLTPVGEGAGDGVSGTPGGAPNPALPPSGDGGRVLTKPDGFRYELFSYRQIVDPTIFMIGRGQGVGNSDYPATIVNWPQNDYFEQSIIDVDHKPQWDHPMPGASGPISARRLEDSRQLSLSVLYWLQTEAPRHDGGIGYSEVFMAPNLLGTEDGFAKYPYIRESRRIKALHTVKEQDVSADSHPDRDRTPLIADSVGIGAYRIDLHPSTSGAKTIDTSSLPFQIPLGSLIPIRVKNLLPAAKNLGVTHITNGCFRLHPVEWNIGESAGALAAYCIQTSQEPAQVWSNPTDYQRALIQLGIELAWPENETLRKL